MLTSLLTTPLRLSHLLTSTSTRHTPLIHVFRHTLRTKQQPTPLLLATIHTNLRGRKDHERSRAEEEVKAGVGSVQGGSSKRRIPGPLDGIRVLDLTRILAGPYCTMILGDYGAEVIKVENPSSGDDTRSWGPPFAPNKDPVDSTRPETAYFLGVNRNKKSITVNFKHEKGREIVKMLAGVSDVLVENFVPGKLDKLGLGYKDLKALNPGLIYASITGYGPDGPSAHKAGYDVIIEAEAGLMHITGEPDRPPVKVGVALTGLYTHGAIMAALLSRARTGQGQKLDISLLECQVASLANIAHSYLIGGEEAQRWGTAHASIVPYQ
ncbi:hypothetical protein HK102_000426, partial [Quaeritorhiza haematococci]